MCIIISSKKIYRGSSPPLIDDGPFSKHSKWFSDFWLDFNKMIYRLSLVIFFVEQMKMSKHSRLHRYRMMTQIKCVSSLSLRCMFSLGLWHCFIYDFRFVDQKAYTFINATDSQNRQMNFTSNQLNWIHLCKFWFATYCFGNWIR